MRSHAGSQRTRRATLARIAVQVRKFRIDPVLAHSRIEHRPFCQTGSFAGFDQPVAFIACQQVAHAPGAVWTIEGASRVVPTRRGRTTEIAD